MSPAQRCRRQNTKLGEIIDLGVSLQNISGRNEALRYLCAQGVPVHTISRILDNTNERRPLRI